MRIIHLSKDNQERITFTEDNAVPVEDMTPLGWDVVLFQRKERTQKVLGSINLRRYIAIISEATLGDNYF